ncbi:iron-containing redox enzyme family protein [Novosphingobium profundi]|uniref:iron-containing redox enzyme family protein n=1 Tax=Novosphingobium profundi TaxID=1774954 RepID=UPI001BDA226B|nr:iron-containing redox enzyme family protein [Novosphingobium profundi]MBT0669313.1 iron-containing redox enzyme family protein [Novosphingobium profundi]
MTKLMEAAHLEAAHRGIARVWIEFESALAQVPVIARLLSGRLRIEDYRSLLFNVRQQVVDGGRWISRAASNLEHEELRSLFIRHAAAEHRDYRMLEDNYVAAGGSREAIRGGIKNIGSEALSAFMFHAASQANPVGLLGAMFVIEGLGNRMAGTWAQAIRSQLGLGEEAVSFLAYHGENDEDHLAMFDRALAIAVTDEATASAVARHAKVVARLYRLQLEELDNV